MPRPVFALDAYPLVSLAFALRVLCVRSSGHGHQHLCKPAHTAECRLCSFDDAAILLPEASDFPAAGFRAVRRPGLRVKRGSRPAPDWAGAYRTPSAPRSLERIDIVAIEQVFAVEVELQVVAHTGCDGAIIDRRFEWSSRITYPREGKMSAPPLAFARRLP